MFMFLNSVLLTQSFYSAFEHIAYSLDYDDITEERLKKAVEDAFLLAFGGEMTIKGDLSYVTIPHTFLYPFYVESYVTSGMVSLDIFFKESIRTGNAGDGFALELFLLLDSGRICALVEQGFCLIAAGAGISQGDGGIFAEAEELGLALETVGHAPELASGRSDVEEKAFTIEVLLRRGFGFQIADLGLSQRHVGTPWILLDDKIPTRTEKALFYNRLTCGYRNMHSTFIPTDIPTKKLDANARPWIQSDD